MGSPDHKRLNYTATYQDETVTRERISKGRAFVVRQHRKIVATILLSAKNYFTNKNTAYLSQLTVDPELKRSGLGTYLMDFCENLAREEGFQGTQLDTAKPATHLVDWYLKRGYKIVGEERWDGKTYESWVFEKAFDY